MIKYLIILVCLSYSSQACREVGPFQIDVRGHSINTRGRVCGDSIALSYSQPVSEIDIAIVGERDTSCHLQDTLLVSNQFMNKTFGEELPCRISVVLFNHTLTIGSVASTSICIKVISARLCTEGKDGHTLRKRSQTSNEQQSVSSSTQKGLPIILSCGLLIVLVISIVASLLGCCYKQSKQNDAEATGGLTDDSFSSACGSIGYSRSAMEATNGLRLHSSSPQDIHLNASPSQPDYISPSLLNIPDIPPSTPPRSSKIRLSTDNIADWSTACEQHYHVLEKPQVQQSITHKPVRRLSRERAYFVLDITSSEQSDPSVVVADAREGPSPSHRIYHVLEPLSSDAEKTCSLCSNPLHEEQDSMYLVILPEQQTVQSPVAAAACEPVYHVLEQPSVICQACLCTENDPIYHELERSPPDPVYDKVKNMIRQETSTSEGSHIYSTVHSLDLQVPPTTSVTDGDDGNSIPFKKVHLGDIQTTSNTSGIYTSISDGFHNQSHKATVATNDTHKQQHHITLLVNSLKSKLSHRLRTMRQGDTTHTDTIDETEHVSETDLNPDSKSDDIQEEERKKAPSPARCTLARSLSHSNYTPVIIAQRKKSGSFHVLNVEDIWQYQLANRYAPISVVMRRTPSPVKLRKGASMKSRKSYIRDYLKDRPSTNHSNYEVPVLTQPVLPFGAIPPPSVLKIGNRNLPRQDALGKSIEVYQPLFEEDECDDIGRIYSVKSEPCLADDDYYDLLDPLSPIHMTPSKSPLRRSISSSCSQSPVKLRYFERYIPRNHQLLNDSDDDDYDNMWDTEND